MNDELNSLFYLDMHECMEELKYADSELISIFDKKTKNHNDLLLVFLNPKPGDVGFGGGVQFGPFQEGYCSHASDNFINETGKRLQINQPADENYIGVNFEYTLGEYDLQLSLLLYSTIWENYDFVRKLYQLSRLTRGLDYDYKFKIGQRKSNSIQHAIAQIKDNTTLGKVANRTYSLEIRNAVMHGTYNILDKNYIGFFSVDFEKVINKTYNDVIKICADSFALFLTVNNLVEKISKFFAARQNGENAGLHFVRFMDDKEAIQPVPVVFSKNSNRWFFLSQFRTFDDLIKELGEGPLTDKIIRALDEHAKRISVSE